MIRLCACGCGQRTPIATQTDRRYGKVKGQPTRFISGHNLRLITRPATPPAEVGPAVRRCSGCQYPLVSQRQKPARGWRQHAGRGLCSLCHRAARTSGDLIDFERITRAQDEVLDEWVVLRSEGYTKRQAAARLGMNIDAFNRALQRAQQAGDTRVRLAEAPTMRRALHEAFADKAGAA